MLITGETDRPTSKAIPRVTLWHCENCGSFVSIQSERVLEETYCPVCVTVMLEFCAAFDKGSGKLVIDA